MSAFDIIALDADDTLWHNERLFFETQRQFRALLAAHGDEAAIDSRLYDVEKRNLRHFGYGIKGFVLSMIETAIELTSGTIGAREIQAIVDMGRQMLEAPVELLPGVRETVEELAGAHPLMLLTKGDLFDQETKLARSGLGDHFSAIEIVSEKNARTYAAIMARHSVAPERFLMVGNSLKSDVLPVLEAGGTAVHIPYDITWVHEAVAEDELRGKAYTQLTSITELVPFIV